MLLELEILNGKLDLEFSPYIYEYTMSVDESIKSLDISYVLNKDCKIKIIDNDLKYVKNLVILNVSNDKEDVNYYIHVYKDNTESVSKMDSFLESVNLNNEYELDICKIQILSIILFLIVLITFSILFSKKRNKKKIT